MMDLSYLKKYPFIYLCSAYTKQPNHDSACREVCIAAAELMRAGVRVFSPIAHSHTVATLSGLDAADGAFWCDQDSPIQRAAGAIVILKMLGWEKSDGIMSEIGQAGATAQPIYGLDPVTLKLTKWGWG